MSNQPSHIQTDAAANQEEASWGSPVDPVPAAFLVAALGAPPTLSLSRSFVPIRRKAVSNHGRPQALVCQPRRDEPSRVEPIRQTGRASRQSADGDFTGDEWFKNVGVANLRTRQGAFSQAVYHRLNRRIRGPSRFGQELLNLANRGFAQLPKHSHNLQLERGQLDFFGTHQRSAQFGIY